MMDSRSSDTTPTCAYAYTLKKFYTATLRTKGMVLEELSDCERFWRDLYPFLLGHGYELRPRFRPGWVPSWAKGDADPLDCEDYISNMVCSHSESLTK